VRLARRYSWELLLVVLIGLAFVWSSRLSPYFLNRDNLVSSAEFYVIFGLMAFGLLPVILHGEIDISLASTLAVGSVLYAKLADDGVPVIVAMLAVLAVGALLGLVNGALVAVAGLPSLAVTLGTLGAFRGIAFLIAGDQGSVISEDRYLVLGDGEIGPVPVSIIVLLVVGAGAAALLAYTSFGRYSYAVGSNPEASRMAGISVIGTKVIGYVLAGVLSGLAGIIWVGQYQSARGDNADGSILFVITAVVLGGVSIKGGSGRAVGVLLALILLGTIQTGMKLANVPGTSQTLVVGLLLIASIGVPKLVQIVRGLQRTPVITQSGRSDAAEPAASNAS
jgi:rhamnose transport system permease protein